MVTITTKKLSLLSSFLSPLQFYVWTPQVCKPFPSFEFPELSKWQPEGGTVTRILPGHFLDPRSWSDSSNTEAGAFPCLSVCRHSYQTAGSLGSTDPGSQWSPAFPHVPPLWTHCDRGSKKGGWQHKLSSDGRPRNLYQLPEQRHPCRF